MDIAQLVSADPECVDAIDEMEPEQLKQAYMQLLEQKNVLELRVQKSEERRRALMHILSDLHTLNRKLNDQRKAMIHILADYEKDRSYLAKQRERLDNSRRALLHILQDSHRSKLPDRLGSCCFESIATGSRPERGHPLRYG